MPPAKKNNQLKLNHLASTTEKFASTTSFIKNSAIANRLDELKQATDDIKFTVKGGLPEEILNHFWVVNYSESEITIAVESVTARNHIHYIRSNLIEILNKDSTMFKNLTSLKVTVVHLPTHN